MLKGFKTEIQLTEQQKEMIQKTFGVCRFVYNLYIDKNKELHENNQKFMTYMDFSKWLNNVYLKENPDKLWIKDVYSKSITKAIINANNAFVRFFKKQSGFPKYKKRKNNDVSMYFYKLSEKQIIQCERHRIKVPKIGWVILKEKNYIPTNNSGLNINSCTISYKAGRYYISALCEVFEKKQDNTNEGIGIDLGLKDFAILSNHTVFKNINKTNKLKKINRRLKRKQRALSRKFNNKNKVLYKNFNKNKLQIQKLYKQIEDIHIDYINKIIISIVRTKPKYITIEDLNVKGMMKNKHLAKSIQEQCFYTFRKKLTDKCKEYGIELRIVDRFYPSSKLCHNCGCIKHDLKLKDRTYICEECGYKEDRDFNASINLRDAKSYKIAA